jgi:predicted metal-dependent enzyme (double-stranded beta helix superfamily)
MSASASVAALVEQCRALLATDPEHAVAGLLAQLLRDGELDAVFDEEPVTKALHRSADLTVVQVVMAPGFAFSPHNHLMWTVAAVHSGYEKHTFYRREGATIRPIAGAAYDAGQVAVLDAAAIHAVRNPAQMPTRGLHVYGGDLLAAPASEWDPQSGAEARWTGDFIDGTS